MDRFPIGFWSYVDLPGYDRALHGPVAGRVRVEPHQRIALVE